jgi:hypothetical protein
MAASGCGGDVNCSTLTATSCAAWRMWAPPHARLEVSEFIDGLFDVVGWGKNIVHAGLCNCN